MKQTLNECVDCGLPCMGKNCPYQNVTRFYCDKCGDETKLYEYYGEELCQECLLKEFKIVEGSEDY